MQSMVEKRGNASAHRKVGCGVPVPRLVLPEARGVGDTEGVEQQSDVRWYGHRTLTTAIQRTQRSWSDARIMAHQTGRCDQKGQRYRSNTLSRVGRTSSGGRGLPHSMAGIHGSR